MRREMSLTPINQSGANVQEGETCVANINASGRRQRLVFSIVQFIITVAILIGLVAFGVDRLWRLPLFLLFAAAAVGFFEWRDKTCVAHAGLGTRQLTDKIEKVADRGELSQTRRQARKIMLKALLSAAVLTLLALALP